MSEWEARVFDFDFDFDFDASQAQHRFLFSRRGRRGAKDAERIYFGTSAPLRF